MIDTPTSSGTWLPAAFTSIASFVTAGLGFFFVRVSDARKDERTYQRERAGRDETRRDKQLERRNELQRKIIHELQETVMTFIRTTGLMNHMSLMAYRETGKWNVDIYPDDLDENHAQARSRMTILGVRVRDNSVREALQQLKEADTATLFIRSKEDYDVATAKLVASIEAFNVCVGSVLAVLDDVEIAS